MAILWKVEYAYRILSSDDGLWSSWWNDTEYAADYDHARTLSHDLMNDNSRPGSEIRYRNIVIKHRSSASEQWRIVKRW